MLSGTGTLGISHFSQESWLLLGEKYLETKTWAVRSACVQDTTSRSPLVSIYSPPTWRHTHTLVPGWPRVPSTLPAVGTWLYYA